MKNILKMDDIRTGMFVTILTGKRSSRVVRNPHGEQVIYKENDKYKGSVLEVITVDLPYVVVRYHIKSMRKEEFRDSLDLREVVLKKLEFDYVKALFPQMQEADYDHFWDGVTLENMKNADDNIHDGFERINKRS